MRDTIRRATGSVRLRVTLVATLLVCVVLVVAAALLTLAVERKLVAENRADADLVVRTVAADFEAGRPFTIPMPTGAGGARTSVGIFTASGEQVRGEALPTFDQFVPAAGSVQVIDSPAIDDATVAMRPAQLGGGTYFVVGVSPLDDVRASVRTMGQNLRLGIPVVTALFAIVAWYLTGRALRPVETIRSEVEAITASTLERRVAVPPTHDEVARLAATMNDMLDRLHDARDRERQFIADASHELRSPLASLRAQLETDPDRGIDSGTRDDLDRLQHVIDDLIDLARATDAPLPDNEVDLDEVVRAEVAAAQLPAGVTIDTSGVDPVKVTGSAPALGRLTRNLLDNAARHSAGHVTVRLVNGAVTGEDGVVLTVDDDGEGVPESERERVFDRFARLDSARTREAGGIGLGLAVVKATAVRHGGDVRCGSSPSGGARFQVTLPCHTPPG